MFGLLAAAFEYLGVSGDSDVHGSTNRVIAIFGSGVFAAALALCVCGLLDLCGKFLKRNRLGGRRNDNV